MGAGKYWGLRWWSTICHCRWRICRGYQCIHTGKQTKHIYTFLTRLIDPTVTASVLMVYVWVHLIVYYTVYCVHLLSDCMYLSLWIDSVSTSKRPVSEGNLSKWSSNNWGLHEPSFGSCQGTVICKLSKHEFKKNTCLLHHTYAHCSKHIFAIVILKAALIDFIFLPLGEIKTDILSPLVNMLVNRIYTPITPSNIRTTWWI